MKTKEKEQIKAHHLRHKGLSLNEISSILKVSKSSVSLWVKDVVLTKKQTTFLGHKAHLKEVIRKRVATRMKHENERRRMTIETHKKAFPKRMLTSNELAILGTTLYWAEGGKSHKNRSFNFTNSDPNMVRVMMTFLKKICKVPDGKFRAHIHLHSHLDKGVSEKYWSHVSGISRLQFFKTTQIINKSSKNTRDTLPYGTFSIQIGSTDLFLKMLAWIEVISGKVISKYT